MYKPWFTPRPWHSIADFQGLGTKTSVAVHAHQTIFLLLFISESDETVALAESGTVEDYFGCSNGVVLRGEGSVEGIIVHFSWKVSDPNAEFSVCCWLSCCTCVIQTKSYRLRETVVFIITLNLGNLTTYLNTSISYKYVQKMLCLLL